MFLQRPAQKFVAFDAQQRQRGGVGLHDLAAQVGGNHAVGDGSERDLQPFGLGGEGLAGFAAFGHVAVDEDRLALVGRRAGGGDGVQRLGGNLHPMPRAVAMPQTEGRDERDGRHDAFAELLDHGGHVVLVDERGEIVSEQILGPVAEQVLVVRADVGVKTVLGHLADEVEGVLGDETVTLLLALRIIARLVQSAVFLAQPLEFPQEVFARGAFEGGRSCRSSDGDGRENGAGRMAHRSRSKPETRQCR